MKFSDIWEYDNGWFIGNFEPSLFKTKDFEIAHHTHTKGEKSTPHYHKLTTEVNYIVSGELIVSGKHLKTGDMWVYEKGEISDVEFLKTTNLIIIRYPSIPGDKYEVDSP